MSNTFYATCYRNNWFVAIHDFEFCTLYMYNEYIAICSFLILGILIFYSSLVAGKTVTELLQLVVFFLSILQWLKLLTSVLEITVVICQDTHMHVNFPQPLTYFMCANPGAPEICAAETKGQHIIGKLQSPCNFIYTSHIPLSFWQPLSSAWKFTDRFSIAWTFIVEGEGFKVICVLH